MTLDSWVWLHESKDYHYHETLSWSCSDLDMQSNMKTRDLGMPSSFIGKTWIFSMGPCVKNENLPYVCVLTTTLLLKLCFQSNSCEMKKPWCSIILWRVNTSSSTFDFEERLLLIGLCACEAFKLSIYFQTIRDLVNEVRWSISKLDKYLNSLFC